MNIQDRLTAELEELEKKVNPVQDTVEANTEEKEEVVDNPEVDEPKAVEAESEEPEKKRRTNWKAKYNDAMKRMAGLKASTDSFKYNTRKVIEDLKQEVEHLKSIPKAEEDPFKDAFTPEDIDVIGGIGAPDALLDLENICVCKRIAVHQS